MYHKSAIIRRANSEDCGNRNTVLLCLAQAPLLLSIAGEVTKLVEAYDQRGGRCIDSKYRIDETIAQNGHNTAHSALERLRDDMCDHSGSGMTQAISWRCHQRMLRSEPTLSREAVG